MKCPYHKKVVEGSHFWCFDLTDLAPVLQEVTSSYFKHIDKPVHSHIPFYGAVCSTVEGDRGTGPSTDGKT